MKLKIDHQSEIPLHVQAEKLLRELSSLEEYKSGKKLPNEVDLSRRLGISRNTLRHSISKLVNEGLLIRKKGVGTTVAKPVDSKAKNWLSFTQEMKSKGIEVVNYDFKLSRVTPPEEVANFFHLENKDFSNSLLKMERVRGDMQKPFVYFVSYFNSMIELTGEEDFSRPLYEILENDFSIIAKLSMEEITAIAASKKIASLLNIQEGDPILKRKRFVYDPGRRPIEFNIGYYKSDSIVYTVESEKE